MNLNGSAPFWARSVAYWGSRRHKQSYEAFRVHFWHPVEFLCARVPRDQLRT